MLITVVNIVAVLSKDKAWEGIPGWFVKGNTFTLNGDKMKIGSYA